MKTYHVFLSDDAKKDLRRYTDYLKKDKKNPQAAKNILIDYHDTRKKLEIVAGSLKESESEAVKSRGLKRLNFLRHDYFLLFKIEENNVIVTNIFHSLEDFENKLN